MTDLETTQSKLRSTPTGGVSGEHSPYYRRLLSAGYKGYIQGSLGGASLYGTMGLAIGALVAIPAAITFAAPMALLAIPAVAGIGALHGAHTFSDIGKTAAVMAEYADSNEKRRYLLDRYYETPSDEEAKAIKEILEKQQVAEKPEKMFHWRTVLVGAVAGLALTAGIMLIMSFAPGTEFLLEPVMHIFEGAHISALGAGALVSAIGAAAGAMIGLDREYVRGWLDKSESVVHDPNRLDRELAEREREIAKITAASKGDLRPQPMGDHAAQTAPIEKIALTPAALDTAAAREPITMHGIGQEKPATTIHQTESKDRLVRPELALNH